MKDLIKAIRDASMMNQVEFAQALGTTPVSINRWENGKSKPNKMAQKQIYTLCMEHDIELAPIILKQKTWTEPSEKLVL